MKNGLFRRAAGLPRSAVGAGVPKWLIVLAAVVVLLAVFFRPIKNQYNLYLCKHKLSVIRVLQEKYYETNTFFAEHPDDLKGYKSYPELEPVCIRVGEETEYFRSYDNPNNWELQVTVRGDWENKCIITANKGGVYVEGVCASKKDREQAAAAEEQADEY